MRVKTACLSDRKAWQAKMEGKANTLTVEFRLPISQTLALRCECNLSAEHLSLANTPLIKNLALQAIRRIVLTQRSSKGGKP